MSDYTSFLQLLRDGNYAAALARDDFSLHRNNALCRLCYDGDIDAIKFLLAHGADPAYKVDNPLFRACEAGHTLIVKLLLTYDAVRKNKQGINGRCLEIARAETYDDIVELLE